MSTSFSLPVTIPVPNSASTSFSNGFNSISLVIPAHQPGFELFAMVEQLARHSFRRIIVVNDGIYQDSHTVLEKLKGMEAVTLLHHEINLGKGAALKTAFRYITENDDKHTRSVITLDADGQHSIEDILAIAQRAESDADKMIIGVRSFSDDVPLRSRFGNLLTRCVLRWTKQVDLNDTQCGLRCLPLDFARETLTIAADHYEFELECILLAHRKNLPIVQLPIQTIYIDDNASSHFRPIVDSLRIYAVFARYMAVSAVSFLLDITLFTLFHYLSGDIIGSTYAARLLSGSFNFHFNKHAAFRSQDSRHFLSQALGYIALAVFIASVSGLAVVWLSSLTGWSPPLVKILIDTQLFIVSFLFQRFVIFRQ